MTGGLNTNHVKAFFQRWERLTEEKERVAEDLKELFAEAKGVGLNPKAMRLAFARVRKLEDAETREKVEAEEADVDLYVAALTTGTRNATQARDAREARVRVLEGCDDDHVRLSDGERTVDIPLGLAAQIAEYSKTEVGLRLLDKAINIVKSRAEPAHDADTGEITETAPQAAPAEQASAGTGAGEAHGSGAAPVSDHSAPPALFTGSDADQSVKNACDRDAQKAEDRKSFVGGASPSEDVCDRKSQEVGASHSEHGRAPADPYDPGEMPAFLNRLPQTEAVA